MAHKIKYQWRITKYNPAFRDLDGNYTKIEEWTSPSDIGKTANGKTLTLYDYLRIETAYIATALAFLSESKLESLRVVQFQKNEQLCEKSNELYEDIFDTITIEEDVLVNAENIAIICKMILRDFIQCSLISKDKFFIHIGWDYYMFIGSNQPCPNGIEFATNNELFVESYPSPYYLTEENTVQMVEWTTKNSEIILDEEKIKKIPLEKLQKIFNLSEENPVIGSFPIDAHNKDAFQKYLNHKIDLTKYDYYLWVGS